MAKKTHPHKRSSVRKAARRKPSAPFSWTYRSRTRMALAVIASALLATASLAYWKMPEQVIAPSPISSESANKSPVKDLSTLSAKELAEIPPEAFHPQPPMPAGYNAHSSGLPPGALPPGVMLPGMTMMQGGRTTAQGYGMNDGVRQQFTSKERDNETGLDYFGARYYSSIQGRFTSVDPGNAGASLHDPQSWNGYSYSLNNPLRFIDPDGLRWAQATVNGGIQYQWFDDDAKDKNGQTAYGRALTNGWAAVDFDESKPFAFTNGLLAPGETLKTVTLNPDGNVGQSSHTVTLGEWTKFLYLNTFADAVFGGHSGADQLNDFVSSIVGARTHVSGSGPQVPGPAIGLESWRTETLSRPLDKMGHASNHLEDFRKIDPSLTEEDVAKILEHVRKVGSSSGTKFGGKAFQAAVDVGGKSVTVKVVESAGGIIKTGYPVP